jgi:hypothetical protein
MLPILPNEAGAANGRARTLFPAPLLVQDGCHTIPVGEIARIAGGPW